MSMNQSKIYPFEQDLAIQYGVNEAIVLTKLITLMTSKNENSKNIEELEDKVWLKISIVELQKKYFKFLSEFQLRRIINSLLKQKALVKGNHNNNRYDKTSWYTVENQKLLKEVISVTDCEIQHKCSEIVNESVTGNGENM